MLHEFVSKCNIVTGLPGLGLPSRAAAATTFGAALVLPACSIQNLKAAAGHGFVQRPLRDLSGSNSRGRC
jgi:hypothetical protein